MSEPFSKASVNLDVDAGANPAPARPLPDTPFHLLLLGDFSGRAARAVPTPPTWKPLLVDRDNVDQVLRSLGAQLHLGGGTPAGRVTLQFREMEDFHPNRIYAQAGVFQSLRDARRDPVRFAPAAAPAPAAAAPPPPPPAPSAGLLDAMLQEAEPGPAPAPAAAPRPRHDDLQDFVRKVTASSEMPREDPRLPELIARVDEATSRLMCGILHHQDFQALEAAWRAVVFLTYRVETSVDLKLYLLDISKAELAADLAGRPDVRDSRLYRLLVDEAAQPWAAVAGNYAFGRKGADVALLVQIAKVAKAAGAPFLAEADLSQDPDSPKAEELWTMLRQSDFAHYLGLALPRFLLRLPYGAETEPIESFHFEEMPGIPQHQDYLWGNPAVACLYLLGEAFASYGWDLRPGMVQDVTGLPLHVYEEDGEKKLTPCAEVLMTERQAESLLDEGFMPLATIRGEGTARLVRFQSIADPLAPLSGRW